MIVALFLRQRKTTRGAHRKMMRMPVAAMWLVDWLDRF